jgi:stalled ribosome rescue protein Dom34
MKNHHATVWLDHEQARIFLFHQDDVDLVKVSPEHPHHHLHVKSDNKGGHRASTDPHFFQDIAKHLEEAAEFVIVGPGSAKLEFVKWLHKHAHGLEPRLVGVETVDHPTDGQIIAYSKKYFRAKDRMR